MIEHLPRCTVSYRATTLVLVVLDISYVLCLATADQVAPPAVANIDMDKSATAPVPDGADNGGTDTTTFSRILPAH